MHVLKRSLVLLLVVMLAAMFAVACGDDEDSSSEDNADDAAMSEDEEDDAMSEDEDAMSEDESMEMGDKTIVELASENPDLSTLAELATAAGLIETLSSEGPYTIFAPTNDAFSKLPAETVANLKKPENREQLAGILTYHGVADTIMAEDLTDGQELTMINERTATISIDGETVMINDATVVQPDVKASNGVVHVIDTVLMPPAGNAAAGDAATGDAANG